MNHTNTILIVDDEPIGLRILEALLTDEGYNLVSARNGPEALAQAAAFTPDLILLDIMMPQMDGFEVCRRLRADALLGEVPVIMVTALDDRESRLRGIEVGADDFITKPIDRVEVRKRVQTIMRLDRYRRILYEREQRQQAEEEMRRRNYELKLLNDFITAAATTLDVYAILRIACEALAQAFELPWALALTLDDTQTCVTNAATYTATPRPHEEQQRRLPKLPATSSVLPQKLMVKTIPALSRVVTERIAVAFEDADQNPQISQLHEFLGEQTVASVLLVPLLLRDRVAGCIKLSTTTPRQFSNHDMALAQSVATAAGQAMETAQLYQQLQSHADQLEETVQQRTLELQTERDRTQAILEALGEAVIVTNKSGIIQYINPAATRLRGLSIEESVGKPWRFWHGSHHSNEQYEQIQASIRAGRTWRGEVTQNHRNGTIFDVAMTVAPLFDPHMPDTSIGAVSVQRDVTPLKEAERMKDQFVSNVSHELRTPLSIITLLSGNLDTLYDRLDHAKRRKMIRDIREHAQVLNDLISSVLEISRIDGHRVSSEHEPLNLVNIVREEVERQMPLAHKKQQTLRLLGPALLPIQGNDSQIRQVIRNILNNAIKYTPNGGNITCEFQGSREAPTAHLDADIEPSSAALWSLLPEESTDIWPGMHCLDVTEAWAALRIIDTGIGISSEDLPHIFERFYRVQSQGNIPGTGLGLSIAQELVGLHEGKLAVASRPGKGSIVAIYLPLAEEDI